MKFRRWRKVLGEKIFGESVKETISRIEKYLAPNDSILDLGAGTCLYSKILKDKGYRVTAVDVKDYGYYSDIPVFVYDGKKLPYKDNTFDVCILWSILHHTPDPDATLKEAARVSKRLVIHENVVTNIFQRFYTYVIDCIMNKELIEPHTNKTDASWRKSFQNLRLTLESVLEEKALLFLDNRIYYLKK